MPEMLAAAAARPVSSSQGLEAMACLYRPPHLLPGVAVLVLPFCQAAVHTTLVLMSFRRLWWRTMRCLGAGLRPSPMSRCTAGWLAASCRDTCNCVGRCSVCCGLALCRQLSCRVQGCHVFGLGHRGSSRCPKAVSPTGERLDRSQPGERGAAPVLLEVA